MDKIKITNPCQFEKLVEELEKTPSLARGFRRGTVPSDFKQLWENIATVLNSVGPPNRTSDGWQKIWRDLKFKVKRKIVMNKTESRATGGGIFKQHILSPLKEAVANMLQFQKQINPPGEGQGVSNAEDELLEMEKIATSSVEISRPLMSTISSTTAPSISTPAISTTAPSISTTPAPSISTASTSTYIQKSKKKIPPSELNQLLEEHSSTQAKILSEISNSLVLIKRSLRDVKDIGTKRLKLEEERNKREEHLYQAEMKIKNIKLEIKEKELKFLREKENK